MSTTVDHRIAERRRRVREAGARRRLRITLSLGALTLLGGLGAWLLQSPYLDVDEIALSGVQRSDAAAVLEAGGVQPGRALIGIRSGTIESALRADPWIESAEVTVVWPGRVEVAVVEAVPAAWIRSGTGWLLVSPRGAVLAEAASPGEGQPLIEVPTARLGPGDHFVDPVVLGAVEFLEALPPSLSAAAVVGGSASSMWADVAGFHVVLGGSERMADKGRSLAALVASGLEAGSTVNLLAPSRPAVLADPSSEGTGTSTPGSGEPAEGQVEGESQEP